MRSATVSRIFCTILLLACAPGMAQAAKNKTAVPANPVVRMTTTLGTVDIELYPAKAPATVKNFLHYVDSGFYNGTVFHRVIAGFMVQGGGFEPGMRLKPTGLPIKNEAANGLTNAAGTIAMARTGDPDSATAQFFINTVDNPGLDHTVNNPQGWGYCVFGKVTKGMDVVKAIEASPTGQVGPFSDVPLHDVVITRAEQVGAGKAPKKVTGAAAK